MKIYILDRGWKGQVVAIGYSMAEALDYFRQEYNFSKEQEDSIIKSTTIQDIKCGVVHSYFE